jgi:hypothetical protein
MLRAASTGDPQNIVFRLMLETDPRYRQQLQTIKKEVVQTQAEIIKGAEAVDAKQTQIVERGERKRTEIRTKANDQFFADLERRQQMWQRVGANIMASANARDSMGIHARGRFERRSVGALSRERNEVGFQKDLNAAIRDNERAYLRYQLQVEQTAEVQRRHTAQIAGGFMRASEGASSLLHGLAALSVVGGEGLQKVAENLLLISGGVAATKGAFNLGRGALTMAAGAGGGSLLAGAGRLAGGALRLGGPVAGIGAILAADEFGYRRSIAQQDARASGYLRSWGTSFDSGMTGMDRRLGQNDFLFGLGMRGSQFAGGIARNTAANARGAGDYAFHQFNRAADGFGGMGGQDIRLSPQARAEHMQRFAGDIERAQRAEMEGLRQNLQIRLREREVVAETMRISVDGLSRAAGLLRDQLATERERQQARLDENRSLAARLGTMDAKDINKLNRTFGNLQGATTEQLRDAMSLPGGAGAAATAEAERRGGKFLEGQNNIAKFLGPNTLDVGRTIATQIASALADKAEENARIIADAVQKVVNKNAKDAADAIVAAQDNQAKIQDMVKQKMDAGRAAMQQAEK